MGGEQEAAEGGRDARHAKRRHQTARRSTQSSKRADLPQVSTITQSSGPQSANAASRHDPKRQTIQELLFKTPNPARSRLIGPQGELTRDIGNRPRKKVPNLRKKANSTNKQQSTSASQLSKRSRSKKRASKPERYVCRA